jgi:hypothetical protein
MPNQEWLFAAFPAPNGEADVVNFLNDPPRQGHGEASVTLRSDGTAGVFYFNPGSLGNSTAQTWQARNFAAPNGALQAVGFLNEALRQGPGEATATYRSDGSVGLIYLEPGSLGTNTTPTWEFRDFTGPDAAQQCVNFLNAPARQGRGEASITPRDDGSVGLIYLVPGSLGSNASPTWFFADFPAPNGVASALAFLNAAPQQGEGELSGYARSDGSAVIFFLAPGSP